jgi:protein-arginine kinase activator protein McsA
MKCQNCNSAEYQDAFDTCIENGHKHRVYICPICEDIFTERILPRHNKYRFNKAKLVDFIGITSASITIFFITYYILNNIGKFTTTF